MQLLNSIYSQLGAMSWPLAAMSLLTLMIILERLVFVVLNSNSQSRRLLSSLRLLDMADKAAIDDFSRRLFQQQQALAQGAAMLLSHRHFAKDLREETISLWLQKKRRSYIAGLRILTIVGVIAPLTGLLGTVMGLIDMFKHLATTQGSIEPAQLADGLGLAMSTTAAGLLIALPAITGAHLFNLWADGRLANIENALNHCNLFIEGVSLEQSGVTPQASARPAKTVTAECPA